MRRHVGKAFALVGLAAGGIVVPVATSHAATPIPTLRLVTVLPSATIDRYGGGYLYANIGLYLATKDGPFEVDVRRASGGLSITQVRRSDGKVTVLRHLPANTGTDFSTGLGQFMHVSWIDSANRVLSRQALPFCPGGYFTSRINDGGPQLPTYPGGCFGSGHTRGAVWGIDKGWAVQALGSGLVDPGDAVPDGTYTLHVRIDRRWVRALHMSTPVSADVTVRLRQFQGCVDVCPPGVGASSRAASVRGSSAQPRFTSFAPKPAVPGPKPDLEPLRAFHLRVDHSQPGTTDVLTFAAMVWNRGAGPLLVEGFRAGARPRMVAKQYFVQDGQVVSKAHVGTLHYDFRRGHQHWHFEDFARYQLVNLQTNKVVRSTKQSFCLAPTDAINLTLPAAEWQPGATGLYSACGDLQSIWIREALPVGWGDTYFQSVAGQAFNISNLPNGRYAVRIVANPAHALYEARYDNNSTLRLIRISGTAGARVVTTLN
jgi:hypothetical protein